VIVIKCSGLYVELKIMDLFCGFGIPDTRSSPYLLKKSVSEIPPANLCSFKNEKLLLISFDLLVFPE
jgi:hypothetical protein